MPQLRVTPQSEQPVQLRPPLGDLPSPLPQLLVTQTHVREDLAEVLPSSDPQQHLLPTPRPQRIVGVIGPQTAPPPISSSLRRASPGRPIASPVSRRETPTPHRYLCLHVPAVSYPAVVALAQPPADSGRVTALDFARPSGRLAHIRHTRGQDVALPPGAVVALAHAPGLRRPVTAISSARLPLPALRAQRHVGADVTVPLPPRVVAPAQAAGFHRPRTAVHRALPGGRHGGGGLAHCCCSW